MMTRHKVPQLRTLRLRHFATIFLDVIYSYIHTAWLSSAVPHLRCPRASRSTVFLISYFATMAWKNNDKAQSAATRYASIEPL